MTPGELSERTMLFALRIVRMAERLPGTAPGRNVASQVTRSACSVAANYRAAQRGRSRADFANKIGIVLEEVDEVGFWLELIVRAQLLPGPRVAELRSEADELIRIVAAMRRTMRSDR